MLTAQNDVGIGHGLLERLVASRGQTDRLFDLVKPDSLYERPIPERHRIVFYIGHLEAFDWNLFRGRAFDVPPFHPEFDRLFAFGIDPVGGGLPTDQPADWPSLAEVRNYVGQVRQILDEELSKVLASNSARREFPVSLLLNVAIEHRLMHAETLAYMLHQLPVEQKIRPSHATEQLVATVEPRMIEIPAGPATRGLSRTDPAFGWDNEYEVHTVDVPAFSIDQYKVTNAEWLEFMAAGGYDRNDLWTDDNWKWRREHGVRHPAFWKWNGAWAYRTMFDEIPFPLDWPVYVSQAEASAFARWVGKSLPTEAQWHRAAYSTPEGNEQPFPWGAESPSAKLGNFDFQRWDPTPVGAFPQSQSAWGVEDLVGSGWEWTSTLFGPFSGFERFPFYPGYSADFFDGKHYVIKGGSARTAACMLRRSFRNWFQPHYQYVYAGFRCVSNQ
jgi:ergothioneine biosynthesis protein EgtB